MSYCTNCGTQAKSEDNFCSNCGHTVESQTADVRKSVRSRKGIHNIVYLIIPLVIGVISVVLALGIPWKNLDVSGKLTIADENQPSELVLEDGTAVVIPPGSLPNGATITIRKEDSMFSIGCALYSHS